MRRLDAGNVFVHAAVRAIAGGTPLPDPPSNPRWTERAAQQGVLSVLAAHLEPTDDPLLRQVRQMQAAHHLRCLADLRVVRTALGEAGLDWLVFKGPVLSEIVYQRPGTRSYGDLDVLVRPVDVDVALHALRRHRAVPLSAGWATKQADGLGEMVLSLPYGTQLDLHWHVLNNTEVRRGFSVDSGELLGAARTVQLDELSVRTLSVVDTALHVALHACKSGGDQLRWLLDMHQSILRLDVPTSELLDRARLFGLELVLRSILNRVTRFVDGQLPVRLPRPAPSQRLWLAADALATTYRPPGSRGEGRFSGAVVARSVRAEPRASWAALVKNVPGVVRTRAQGACEVGGSVAGVVPGRSGERR